MNVEKVISMVASLRTQTEILLEELMKDVIPEETPVLEPVECEHPPDYRLSLSTLGSPARKWRCKLCGYEYEEK